MVQYWTDEVDVLEFGHCGDYSPHGSMLRFPLKYATYSLGACATKLILGRDRKVFSVYHGECFESDRGFVSVIAGNHVLEKEQGSEGKDSRQIRF